MKMSDAIKGKEAKYISQYLARATIADAVEITSKDEINKRVDELKQSLAKSSSSNFIVVAYKV